MYRFLAAACVASLVVSAGQAVSVAPVPVSAEAQPARDRTASAPEPFADLARDLATGRFSLGRNTGVPTPESVIGHELGERFTRVSDIVRYSERLAEASDRVITEEYGRSYQNRPLVLVTLSSPDNLERLDEILAANRELADPATSESRVRAIVRDNPAVVWLSFNVHGNEASCSEAALNLMHILAASNDERVVDMLDNLIIAIDPCLNPDGRDRYVQWYDNELGAQPDPTPWTSEHREPWPGGRSNHYLFDLNRDWTWLSQVESAQRLEAYRRYLPQFHCDYHEQGAASPYFFGPGDDPYNEHVPAETKAWLEFYGRSNAAAFDAAALPYQYRERFDYLYPGYGKVTPVYHGAVSLLTEQGGHSRAGLAYRLDDTAGTGEDGQPGAILTLDRRMLNHTITAVNYLEATSANRAAAIERFRRFWTDSAAPAEDGALGFVVMADDPARRAEMLALCEAHGIEVREIDGEQRLTSLLPHWSPEMDSAEVTETIPDGSLYVPAAQPMGRYARVLFERETFVADPETYDITGWSVPLMYGFEAFEAHGEAPRTRALSREAPARARGGERSLPEHVAIMVNSRQAGFDRALAIAGEMRLFCRLTDTEVSYGEGEPFGASSLVVMGYRNTDEQVREFVRRIGEHGVTWKPASRGIADDTTAIGNNANERFRLPRVVLAGGPGTSSLSYGAIWHLLDRQRPTPHHRVDVRSLGSVDWEDMTTLVLPEGASMSGSTLEAVRDWVRSGGTVVAVGSAGRWATRELIGLSDENLNESDDDDDTTSSSRTYEQRQGDADGRRTSGALALATIDTTHPIARGLGERVAFHIRGDNGLPVSGSGHVLARFGDSAERPEDAQGATAVYGKVADDMNIDGEAAVTLHRFGRGKIIAFGSDPTQRAMNKAGMDLLMRAILLGPSY